MMADEVQEDTLAATGNMATQPDSDAKDDVSQVSHPNRKRRMMQRFGRISMSVCSPIWRTPKNRTRILVGLVGILFTGLMAAVLVHAVLEIMAELRNLNGTLNELKFKMKIDLKSRMIGNEKFNVFR